MPSKGKKIKCTKDNGARTHPRPTTKSNISVPELPAEGQGDIFGSYSQPARMRNTPLGIQTQRYVIRGNHVTTLRQIEVEATIRKAKLQARHP